jgi:hypothetical protein
LISVPLINAMHAFVSKVPPHSNTSRSGVGGCGRPSGMTGSDASR